MKVTLVLGASENAMRTSHTAVTMLIKKGYPVIAVGKNPGMIGQTQIHTEIPEDVEIDTITLYINPTIQKSMEDKIFQAKPKRIIFNPGTENRDLEEKASALGIETIQACSLVLLSTNQF